MMETSKIDYAAQIDALSKSVIGIDGSRRVGWAKAFAALDKVDELERDAHAARDDREIYRNRFSFTWGYVKAILWLFHVPGSVLTEDLRRQIQLDLDAEQSGVLDHAQVRAGKEQANAAIEKLAQLDNDAFKDPAGWILRQAEKKSKKRRERIRKDEALEDAEFGARVADKVTELARRQALLDFAQEQGYNNVPEMRKALRRQRPGYVDSETYDVISDKVIGKLAIQYGLSDSHELHRVLGEASEGESKSETP